MVGKGLGLGWRWEEEEEEEGESCETEGGDMGRRGHWVRRDGEEWMRGVLWGVAWREGGEEEMEVERCAGS